MYDILGGEVATIVDGVRLPGGFTARLAGSKMPSGVYFYFLTSGEFTATRKAVLIK